jgi:integrase
VTLTAPSLNAMKPGDRLKDTLVAGLEARRHPTGTSFLLYYRTRQGVARRPKIGSYPTISIAQARDIARGLLVQVAAGNDPMASREQERQEPTMALLWDRCEQEHWHQEQKWAREAKGIWLRVLAPKLAKTKVSALTYTDIQAIHATLSKTPNAANRALAVASKMLSLAERWGMRPPGSNPCALVQRFQEKKRRRYAAPDEILKIGSALDKLAANPEHATGIAFLSVLMFSGARPSEIERATPSQLEPAPGGAAVLRIEKGKTGERAVYLPAQAVAALARLPKDREKLCGRATVPRRLWKAVLKESGVKGLWARDLRRTFATLALTNGVSLSQVGELLGHKSAQTTKVYALLMEDAAHKAAAGVAQSISALIGASGP